MENKQMLEEFLELVQIPVNSRNERQIADVLKAKLEALGLEVTEEDTGAKIRRQCRQYKGSAAWHGRL